jgi:predicted component of type VI protein secretion system
MNLVLRCVALNDQTMSKPLIGRFDERGGTIGRSDDANLTLPDPERGISRLQAQVLHRDNQYWLENVSSVIPVLHNGHPVGQGMQVSLHERDELTVSHYVLQVAFEDDSESDAILRGRTVSSSPTTTVVPKAQPASAREALSAPPSHQAAVTAGMRAALDAVLERLNPGRLEVPLGKRTWFERLWPSRRAVRLWRLYVKEHAALRTESQADFHDSVGQTFRAGYESHIRNVPVGPDETVRPVETTRSTAERGASVPPKGTS